MLLRPSRFVQAVSPSLDGTGRAVLVCSAGATTQRRRSRWCHWRDVRASSVAIARNCLRPCEKHSQAHRVMAGFTSTHSIIQEVRAAF